MKAQSSQPLDLVRRKKSEELNQPVFFKEEICRRGDKDKYTDKQKRQAEHIEESYENKGVSEEEAEKRAWATVNKLDGGGKKSGSGRANSSSKKSSS